MEYTQGFKHRKRICPTFCVTEPTKRLPMSATDCYQAIGCDPSDCLTKRLDVNQAIASFPSDCFFSNRLLSFTSDCFSVVCYIDVATILYNAVICSIMSWYDYPVLFQMYGCLYDVIMSNNVIGTPNLIERCI